jgi:hypothetical protein
MLIKYLSIWQQNFAPTVINEIQENISNFIIARYKQEEIVMRFYCALGLLALYTARIQNKPLAMRKFSAMENINNLFHYIYVGIIDYPIKEVFGKIQEKTSLSEGVISLEGSYFSIKQRSL